MREKRGAGKTRQSWATQIPLCLVEGVWGQGARRLDSSWLLGAGPLDWAPAYWKGSGLDIFRPVTHCTLWSLFSLCEMEIVTAPKHSVNLVHGVGREKTGPGIGDSCSSQFGFL